jgi:hypothetical protein
LGKKVKKYSDAKNRRWFGTSPKKTISGFMTGTAAKGEAAAAVTGGSQCDADSGDGKGAEAEGRSTLLDGCCCCTAEDTDERPSSVSVEAFSRPAASAAAGAASVVTAGAASVVTAGAASAAAGAASAAAAAASAAAGAASAVAARSVLLSGLLPLVSDSSFGFLARSAIIV